MACLLYRRIPYGVFVLIFMCDGPIFRRQKMVAANGKKKRKKEKSHLLLLYFTISENTPFLPGNYISLTFS